MLITSTVAVAVSTTGATLLAALEPESASLDAGLTDLFFVLSLALFLGAGALRVTLWQLDGDARSLMTGAALVVLGGCALPLTRMAGVIMESETSLLKAMTALATTLVVLTLVVRALNTPASDDSLRPLRVVAGAVVTATLIFLGLVALHLLAPALLTSTAVAPPLVRGALLSVAWFCVGLEATIRSPHSPSAARLAPLLGGMAISEIVRVMSVVHPDGGWEVTGAGLVAVVACVAVHGALVDLDGAGSDGRASEPVPVPAVRLPVHAVRRNRVPAVPTALEHLIIRRQPEDTVDFAVRAVIGQVLGSGLADRLDVEVLGPEVVANGRPTDLATVLHTLLVNAAEYAAGPVTVEVTSHDDRVEVQVSDHGPGMPLSQVATLFQRGARGPASTGAGLGLHVAHALMQQQGGDLRLRSHVSGCVFAVTLWPAGGPPPAMPYQRRSRRAWAGDLTPRTAE